MYRTFPVVLAALLASAPVWAGQGARASEYDHLVAKHAAAHGVPEALVRRVIHIESKGNPRVVSKGNYGLMQIRLGTARAMGYGGDANGLLNADTNMAYAVRYLAGAYRAAGGNSEQAIRNYQRGYYDRAKARGFSPYALASTTQQPAAPDPTMLPPDAPRQQAIEQKAVERQAIEQQRAAQRQAGLQARVEQQRTAEQERQAALQDKAERQRAVEQQRIAQRQAALQQQIERDQAKQQQRVEREQARVQQKIEQPRPPSAPTVSPSRAAAAQAYSWYHPMRYFKHPAHQTHPIQRER